MNVRICVKRSMMSRSEGKLRGEAECFLKSFNGEKSLKLVSS